MRIDVTPPFDLEATVRLLQRRPRNPLDRFVEGSWLRLLDLPGGPVPIAVEQRAPGALELRWLAGRPSTSGVRHAVALVRRTLGLDAQLTTFHRADDRFPGLARLAPVLRGVRPPRFTSLFEAIVGVVPFQQVSLDAGMAVFARVIEAHGARLPVDGPAGIDGLYTAPRPDALADVSEAELAAHGMSRAKARSLQRTAAAIATGELSASTLEDLPTPQARAQLVELPGIGPWSADLILLRGFGRLDAFPPRDVGVARGLGALLGATPPEELARAFAPQQGMLYYTSLIAQLVDRGILRPGSAVP